MQNKEIYEYAIIRIVPKVERGEFMNIGVIVLSKKMKYLDMKYHIDEDKLRAFSKDIDITLLQEYVDGWKLVCEGGSKGGEIGALETHVRFRWLTANRSTIIQSSPVHSGFSSDMPRELRRLFKKFVL